MGHMGGERERERAIERMSCRERAAERFRARIHFVTWPYPVQQGSERDLNGNDVKQGGPALSRDEFQKHQSQMRIQTTTTGVVYGYLSPVRSSVEQTTPHASTCRALQSDAEERVQCGRAWAARVALAGRRLDGGVRGRRERGGEAQ
jgi:hypothetical protein